MIDVIEGIRRNSSLFNEPPQPKPDRAALARELDEIVELLAELRRHNEQQLRRIENRVVILKEKLAKLPEVGL